MIKNISAIFVGNTKSRAIHNNSDTYLISFWYITDLLHKLSQNNYKKHNYIDIQKCILLINYKYLYIQVYRTILFTFNLNVLLTSFDIFD